MEEDAGKQILQQLESANSLMDVFAMIADAKDTLT